MIDDGNSKKLMAKLSRLDMAMMRRAYRGRGERGGSKIRASSCARGQLKPAGNRGTACNRPKAA